MSNPMSEQKSCVRCFQHVWLLLIAVLLASGNISAEELGGRALSWEPRVPAAKNLAPTGTLLFNERPGQPWRGAAEGDTLYSRDLLQALPGLSARLETRPRAVELTLWGNLPQLSQFFGLQSAVILHDSRAFDLDFTLQRGRVLLTNRKDSGPARVWLRIEGAAFELTLADPGATVCLGLYSFWPSGVGFNPSAPAEETPVRRLMFFALKGEANVKDSEARHTLSPPPGRAYFQWDSINGAEQIARSRRQVDAWADPNRKPSSQTKALSEVIEKYQAVAKNKEPRTVLFDLLDAAGKERERARAQALAEFSVFGLAALNDIDRVMQALDDPRQAEARKAAVTALRHWIGDAAGRDQRLYQYLTERLRYSKPQSATVLQLLHGALAADDPDTYDTLLAYLRHEKLSIRELAWRHLLRMVPEDLAVPYDPAATAAERAKAYAAWKEVIPSGSLPARKSKKK
jgi:hypothetical protein